MSNQNPKPRPAQSAPPLVEVSEVDFVDAPEIAPAKDSIDRDPSGEQARDKLDPSGSSTLSRQVPMSHETRTADAPQMPAPNFRGPAPPPGEAHPPTERPPSDDLDAGELGQGLADAIVGNAARSVAIRAEVLERSLSQSRLQSGAVAEIGSELADHCHALARSSGLAPFEVLAEFVKLGSLIFEADLDHEAAGVFLTLRSVIRIIAAGRALRTGLGKLEFTADDLLGAYLMRAPSTELAERRIIVCEELGATRIAGGRSHHTASAPKAAPPKAPAAALGNSAPTMPPKPDPAAVAARKRAEAQAAREQKAAEAARKKQEAEAERDRKRALAELEREQLALQKKREALAKGKPVK